jgi:hypothetical protein
MSVINAGPSPAWLGALAIISFGGLVVAAFASGYHLASDAPSDMAALRAGSSSRDATSRSASSNGSETDPATAFAPIPGMIAEPLIDIERAQLTKEPGESQVLAALPPGQRVTISREAGDYLFVRYEREGKEHEGWAHRINIEREEP